jgi:hypothetical protein
MTTTTFTLRFALTSAENPIRLCRALSAKSTGQSGGVFNVTESERDRVFACARRHQRREKVMKPFDLNEYRKQYAEFIKDGLMIDPANAEVSWSCQPVILQAGQDKHEFVRFYAARKPPNGPWIDFHNLENPIESELWDRLESGQMQRAGYYLISVDDPTAHAELVALRLKEEAEREVLKQTRIEAGKLIDPALAELCWHHADGLDPYRDWFPGSTARRRRHLCRSREIRPHAGQYLGQLRRFTQSNPRINMGSTRQ